MDAHESVPQPQPAPESTHAQPLDAAAILALTGHLCDVLRDGGAFDDLPSDQAARVRVGLVASASDSLDERRVGYGLILEVMAARPDAIARAMQRLRARLLALLLPEPSADLPPGPPAAPLLVDVLLVSPRVAHTVDLLLGSPVTRWIDGTLYIGASPDRLYRVIRTDADWQHRRIWLTTADHELWLVTLDELTPPAAA